MKVTSLKKIKTISFTIFLMVLFLSFSVHTNVFAQDKQHQHGKQEVTTDKTSKQSSSDKKSETQVKKSEKEELVCVVSGEEADPSLKMEYKGKTYYFCCKKCLKKFKDNPEKYLKSSE